MTTKRDLRGLIGAACAVTLSAMVVSPLVLANSIHGQAIEAADSTVEVFVRLDRPSVSEYRLKQMKAGRADPSAAAQKKWAKSIDAQQESFRSVLSMYGATEVSSLRVGANGITVKMDRADVASLRNHPDVVSVAEVDRHYPDNAQSVPWIGAPEFWAAFGTGEGVSVGIIDTGIDYFHANYGGSGDPNDFNNNDETIIEPGSFPTAKVVGGYDFVGDGYTGENDPIPDPDPVDCNGHGTHVAGTAAGLGVPGVIGPGVAKGADLYALSVFGCSGFTTVTSQAIEWAMDPNGDGDMSDHLDVINMSLGSTRGSPDDPSAITSSNAAAVGIIVVASAGNSGPQPYVTGSPGVTPEAISVAASTKGGEVPAINVSAPASVAGDYEAIEAVFTPPLAVTGPKTGPLSVPADPANFVGCNPIGNDMSNSIALISRGGCRFDTKVANAEAANAIGVVIYNNNPGAPPIRMGGNPGATIPAVMITFEAGTALAASVAVEPTIATMDATLTTETAFFDLIATFSSAGPGHGGSQFKPEVTAPGVAIVSAAVGTGTGPLSLQGTSMAAPHVAGMAALLRSKHPDADQSVIKSLIMNGTVDMNPANGLLPLTLQGTGRVDVPTAAGLSSYTTPAGISFGRVNPWKPVSDKQKVVVTDMSGSPRYFTITHIPNQTVPGVSVSCDPSVDVAANGSSFFDVSFSMDPAAAPADFSQFTQTEVDGWCVLDDGTDTLRVGYLAVVDPASRIQARPYKGGVVLENRGPAAGLAEGFTWVANGDSASNGSQNSIKQTGFRTNSLFGVPVIEFGIATDAPWELLSQNEINIFIDVDKDGSDDVLLQATDWSTYNGTVGVLLTAQFDLVGGGGFLDWLPSTGDYNDNVVALPFTLVTGGGLVPDSFDYRIEFDGRDGSQGVQYGSVDLADEIVHDASTVVLAPGEKVMLDRTKGARGNKKTLWFFPSNATPPSGKQVDFVVGK